MTEAEWLACVYPQIMLEHVRERISSRKMRLFACACCFHVWDHLQTDCQEVLLVVDRYADGGSDQSELAAASERAASAARSAEEEAVYWAAHPEDWTAATHAFMGASGQEVILGWPGRYQRSDRKQWSEFAEENCWEELSILSASLRDIFGNPFRPVAFDPAWRTETAMALARGMYESRDFGAMPILADALQDAGCDNEDVLGHCRDAGPHVRGCWVVDLVQGKK